ncbi:hypothetical protein Tco_0445216, partial [Tanacetum coccineum]
MTTLAEHMIVAGAENRPPMLEIQCMIHGQVVYDYSSKGSYMEGLCIALNQEGSTQSYTHWLSRGETLYEYYWRFSQLINDMHTIGMTIQQVQFNTKFLNALPPEWSKFATDVKLEKRMFCIPPTMISCMHTSVNMNDMLMKATIQDGRVTVVNKYKEDKIKVLLKLEMEELNYGVLGEVYLKDTHFGAYMKNSRKSTDLTANTPSRLLLYRLFVFVCVFIALLVIKTLELGINALALIDRHPTYYETPSDQ